MRAKSTDELLREYRESAARHGQAMEDGNARRCNRAYGDVDLRPIPAEHLAPFPGIGSSSSKGRAQGL